SRGPPAVSIQRIGSLEPPRLNRNNRSTLCANAAVPVCGFLVGHAQQNANADRSLCARRDPNGEQKKQPRPEHMALLRWREEYHTSAWLELPHGSPVRDQRLDPVGRVHARNPPDAALLFEAHRLRLVAVLVNVLYSDRRLAAADLLWLGYGDPFDG